MPSGWRCQKFVRWIAMMRRATRRINALETATNRLATPAPAPAAAAAPASAAAATTAPPSPDLPPEPANPVEPEPSKPA